MAWVPASTNLGSVDEGISFSHPITYTDDLTFQSYPVTITASETYPTVSITGSTIAGYYNDSFNYSVQYLDDSGKYETTSKFSSININSLHEMISYKASMVTSKTVTYTAQAMNGQTVVATQVYTKTITNNWTSGKNLLQSYVGMTA